MQAHSLTRVLLMTTAVLASSNAQAKDIQLTNEQVDRLEIKLEAVSRAEGQTLTVLPGTVIPPVNARVVATAPFAGTVTQVAVLPGQRVAKGDKLATVSSRELLEAQAQLSQAEAELQIAEAVARRKRTLADKNFQSPVVADEAEAQVAKVKAVIEQHRRTLAINAIAVGQGGDYALTAQSDGVVVAANVMPGDKIDAMGPAVTLDTGNAQWVDVQIPAALVATIKPGDAVQVVGGPRGRVVSVGTSLEGVSRSARVYAELSSESSLLPGQLVAVKIERASEASAVSVPRAALTRVGDKDAVFVRSATGFTVKPVELRGQSTEVATVVGDLATDSKVAASRLPQLEQMLPETK